MNSKIAFYDFLVLSRQQQLELVYRLGQFLEAVRNVHTTYALYGLSNFYVELVLTANGETVLNVVVFTQGAHLNKYLELIDLRELQS